jgi:hypothetical protein
LDARFAACINMDGLIGSLPFYPDAAGAGPAQAFMLLTKPAAMPSDEVLAARWGLTRAEWQVLAEAAEARQAALLGSLAGASYRVTVAGAAHDSFSDTPLLAPWPFNARLPEAERHLAVVRAVVRAFFDEHLLGQAGAVEMVTRDAAVSAEVFGTE